MGQKVDIAYGPCPLAQDTDGYTYLHLCFVERQKMKTGHTFTCLLCAFLEKNEKDIIATN